MKVNVQWPAFNIDRPGCIIAKQKHDFSIAFLYTLVFVGGVNLCILTGATGSQSPDSFLRSSALEARRGTYETGQFKSTLETKPKCLPDIPPKDPRSKIDYQIVCVWPPGHITGVRLIFGVINPKHLNREDMLSLAGQLKRHFPRYANMRVLLWDNDDDAQYYGKAKLDDFSGAQKNLRATYVLNREEHREHIEFTPDKSQPKEKVKIDLKSALTR